MTTVATHPPGLQQARAAVGVQAVDQLERADASIVTCSWCDRLSFTNPCYGACCPSRNPESGNQNRSTQ